MGCLRKQGHIPSDFAESLLKEVFGTEIFSQIFAVERAHQVPSRPPPPGAPSRPFLMKLLHYVVLCKARDLKDVEVADTKITRGRSGVVGWQR